LRVAVSQLRIEEESQHHDGVLEAIARAADEADVICFPEYFLGKTPPEPMPNAALRAIQEVARLAQINVVAGVTRDLRHGDGSYLTSFVVDRAGQITAGVDKTCLYPAEQLWYRAGRGRLRAELDGDIGVGILAGFDLMRGDLVHAVVEQGAQFLVAQFATDSHDYLETVRAVIRTRAMEHRLPVVAVGQLGRFFGREFIGGSTVMQPTMAGGDVPGPVECVLSMGDEEDMWVVDLDLDSFREMRRRFSYYRPLQTPQR
jgi:predicted amidohydrolase